MKYGVKVFERKVTLTERRGGGPAENTEVIAWGLAAAVITSISVLEDASEFLGSEDVKAGEITLTIREQAQKLGGQASVVVDRHGWLSRPRLGLVLRASVARTLLSGP